jgi:CRISPR type I-E-associated protein CasB/Cse2
MSINAMMQRLESLAIPAHEDRAALARLRRAQKPEGYVEAYRYIMEYVEGADKKQLDAYILVASLFGHNPRNSNERYRNIGNVCREIADTPVDDASERRFLALLQADRPELKVGLYRMAKMADRKGLAINYTQLFWDIENWDDPKGNVQKQWAGSFYPPEKNTSVAEAAADDIATKED